MSHGSQETIVLGGGEDIAPRNTTENPEIDPHKYNQLVLKRCNYFKKERIF